MKPETKTKKNSPEPATENKNFILFRLVLRLDALRNVLRLKDELRGGYNPELYKLIDSIEILSRQLI